MRDFRIKSDSSKQTSITFHISALLVSFTMAKLAILLIAAVAVAGIGADILDGSAPSLKFKTEEIAGQDARDKLLDELFATYKTYSYPENSTVSLGITLLDLSLDAENHVMNTDIWMRYTWTDKRFVWDAEATGVTLLRVPSDKIWLPDVTLYNSATQKERSACWDSNVIIYATGKIIWVPPCQLTSYCNLTLAKDPYGEQKCILKFGSWTFDGNTMDLQFFDDKKFADVDYFLGNPEFEITENTAERNVKKYDCCVEPYLDLTFTLGLKRIDPSVKCESKQ